MATLFDDLVSGGGDLYYDNLNAAPLTGDEPQIATVGTLRFLGTATITGVNFGASQGAGFVSIGGVSQPVTAWSDTSITIGPIARGALRYGTQNVVVVSDADGASNPSAQPFLPQTGWNYVNLVNPLAASGDRITATPSLAAGDQLAWGNVTPSGTVTVASDASFVAGTGVGSFAVECNDGTGWGGFATQTVSSVDAFSGAIQAGQAVVSGSFTVQVPDTSRTFSGAIQAGAPAASGVFLVFTSIAFSGEIAAGPATVSGSFNVVGAVAPSPAPPTQVPGGGMPASRIAIVNDALILLGAATIRSFTDNNKQARVASQVFDRVRDRELARYIWKFALHRKRMPEFVSDEPRGGYRYQYTKPVDWLRTVWLGDLILGSDAAADDVHDADWQHEGEYILCNLPPPMTLQYIRRLTDPTKYDVLFIEALAARLAMEMCEAITGSTTQWEKCRAVYRDAVADARRANAIFDPPRGVASDSWLNSRN